MKLRNRNQNFLNTLPEGTAKVSRTSKVLHWGYFLLLALLLVYLGRYVYLRLTQIEGYGEVVIERKPLAAVRGGRIGALSVKEGEKIHAGQMLVRIDAQETCLPPEETKLLQAEYDIQQKRAHLETLQAKWRDLHSERMLRRALELDDSLRHDERELPYQIALLKKELILQKEHLNRLRMARQSMPPATECLPQWIESPVSGRVNRVLKHPFEVVKTAETVLMVEPAEADVMIEGYLSKYDFKSLFVGKEMTVLFPDEKTGKGRIVAIHSAAYAFPERKWQEYEPADSPLRVTIAPEGPGEAKKWRAYNLLRVELRGAQI
ncbi:HlyD family efflux transporter periplasmic adaptor subunit [Methylohalobius crimeensis]|uniref:HlyD family efflux transporter periplasmic adaptor subunit n=1 Tax=Methylohalobius crimeensis TaxID=244365 RepID=UPI0003B56FE4|nr:HlyD family efflux transporter periplasmic adaptor subunit [Methylohalobius crimeensis]